MQHILNIVKVYHQAGPGEIEAGLRWYRQALEDCDRLAKGLPLSTVVGIVAALSPGLRWERNIAAAERIIGRQGLEGLGVRWYDGARKAERIREGETPLDVLRGNKVRAFYHCILNPRSSEHVCIDGHAYAIWQGERTNLDETPSLSDNLYLAIERDYRAAADSLCVSAPQLQAITWVCWRRLHSVNSAHYLPLFEEVG